MPRRDFYGAQSTLPAAAKEAFVRRVLFMLAVSPSSAAL
jgi:hypothetical protein